MSNVQLMFWANMLMVEERFEDALKVLRLVDHPKADELRVKIAGMIEEQPTVTYMDDLLREKPLPRDFPPEIAAQLSTETQPTSVASYRPQDRTPVRRGLSMALNGLK